MDYKLSLSNAYSDTCSRLSTAFLPTLGAILIVFSVLADPFAQQIVKYESCLRPSANGTVGIIPRVNRFANPHALTYRSRQSWVIDPQTEGAFYAGMFQNENSMETNPFRCDTSQCEFNDYYSLGFCSQCEDISNEIKVNNSDRKVTTCSLPSGLQLKWHALHGPRYRYDTLFNMHLINKELPRFIRVELIAGLPTTDRYGTSIGWSSENPKLGAARCSLYPCVQHCKASVNKGVLNETYIRSFPFEFDVPGWNKYAYFKQAISVLKSCLNQSEVALLLANGCDLSTEDPLIYLKCLSYKYDEEDVRRLNPTCVFGFPQPEWNAIWLLLRDSKFFTGNIRTRPTVGLDITEGPPQLSGMFNGGNMSYDRVRRRFQGIALALTRHMRLVNNASVAIPVLGTAMEATTCVQVRWGWIALPIALLLLTLLLLFCTLKRSSETLGSSWKSSTMALLFHGLENGTVSKHSDLRTRADMERASRLLNVRLQETNEGWRFALMNESNRSLPKPTSAAISRAESQTSDSVRAESTSMQFEIETFP